MPIRVSTKTENNRKKTPNFSTAPAQGMFESRPFVVQSKTAQAQPDLKTSLMRAERYGHNLSQIQPAGFSAATTVQPKMGMAQPIKLDRTEAPQMLQTKLTDRAQPTAIQGGFGVIQPMTDADTEKERYKSDTENLSSQTSSEQKPESKERKPVDYFKAKSHRFIRNHRIKKLNKRSGLNLATAKLRFKNAAGDPLKTRYLTMPSEPGKHSEQNIFERVGEINEKEAEKQTGRTAQIEKLSSEREDCGKDNQNCNKKVAEHPDKPKYRFALKYADRRDYLRGRKDESNLTPEKRKQLRKNSTKKLEKADTTLRNLSEEFTFDTTKDSDYSDLEHDGKSSGTDTEYETDVETANWKSAPDRKKQKRK